MRVLWFSSSSTGYTSERNPYNGGGWAASALNQLKKNPNIQLGVSFMLQGEPFKAIQDGVTFYPMPAPAKSSISYKLRKLWAICGKGDLESIEKESWKRYIPIYQRIIEDFKPDLIHIWGSEQRAGIISAFTEVPIVLHIQGVLNPYYNASLPPAVSLQMSYSSSNILRSWMKCRADRADWLMGCFRERFIFEHIHHYMGRTQWDEAVSRAMSPNLTYYHCDEYLRDVFYEPTERKIPERLTIVSTISFPLFKGFDLILKTASILKNNYHLDFEWKCFGNIDCTTIEKITKIRHEECNVSLMGIANASELKDALLNATLYCHPSYIDNSPNSVCEAQMVGLPVVCTNVGGVSSIVMDHEEGFLIPANDPYMAAYRIVQLFKDPDLNVRMGNASAAHAQKRHDKGQIFKDLISVYQAITNSTEI